MEHPRREERPQHEPSLTAEPHPGVAPERQEHVPQDLVPAPAPEVVQRRRAPRAVVEWVPRFGRVAEDAHSEEGDEVVPRLDPEYDHEPAGHVDRSGEGVAQVRGEVREEHRAALGGAYAGDELEEGVAEVDGEEMSEEVARCVEEELFAFCGGGPRGYVDVPPEVPANPSHGQGELESVSEPWRKESAVMRLWVADAFEPFLSRLKSAIPREREVQRLSYDVVTNQDCRGESV